jgi:NADH:ubiquinone oxidoreductase subunit 2 (subunit N)
MQFILNLSRISLTIVLSGLHYKPSTVCLHMWPPDQFVPESLTLFLLLSTMTELFVCKGNFISFSEIDF